MLEDGRPQRNERAKLASRGQEENTHLYARVSCGICFFCCFRTRRAAVRPPTKETSWHYDIFLLLELVVREAAFCLRSSIIGRRNSYQVLVRMQLRVLMCCCSTWSQGQAPKNIPPSNPEGNKSINSVGIGVIEDVLRQGSCGAGEEVLLVVYISYAFAR